MEEENQHFQSWVGADAVVFEGLRNLSKIDLLGAALNLPAEDLERSDESAQ